MSNGADPSRDDYSTLDMADLHYAARILEEMAVEVASAGAGRKMAEKVDLAGQAVRLAIEILDDLHATVLACDTDRSGEADETRNAAQPIGREPGPAEEQASPKSHPEHPQHNQE